jgi:hypothetical protein
LLLSCVWTISQCERSFSVGMCGCCKYDLVQSWSLRGGVLSVFTGSLFMWGCVWVFSLFVGVCLGAHVFSGGGGVLFVLTLVCLGVVGVLGCLRVW